MVIDLSAGSLIQVSTKPIVRRVEHVVVWLSRFNTKFSENPLTHVESDFSHNYVKSNYTNLAKTISLVLTLALEGIKIHGGFRNMWNVQRVQQHVRECMIHSFCNKISYMLFSLVQAIQNIMTSCRTIREHKLHNVAFVPICAP